MKKKSIIFICILVVVLFGLFSFIKFRSGINRTTSVETLLNNVAGVNDCKLFPDVDSVIESKNIKGCDCLAEDLKDGCKESVSDGMFYLQAYTQLDSSFCDKMSYEEGRAFCLKVVADRLASLEKDDSDNLLLTYISAGNYNEAIKILEGKLVVEPKIVKYLDLLARSYAEKALIEHKEAEYIPKALVLVEKAKTLEVNNPEIYTTEGFVYEVKPDLEKAIESYNQALALDVNNILAYARRGHSKEMLGDTDGAFADFTKAASLDVDQKSIYTYSNLCRLNLYFNNLDDSITNCSIVMSSSLASAGAKSEAAQILGSIYSSLGKYDEAWTQYKIAETYTPNSVNLMLSIGRMLMRQGEAVSAEEYSRKAIVLDPKKAIAYENLAASLMLQKKYEESISNALQALSLVPTDVSILSNYKKNVNFRIYSVLIEVYKGMGDTTNQSKYEVLRDSLK